MSRGRQPQSDFERRLHGDPGKRGARGKTITAPPGAPSMPSYLSAEGKCEWRRVCGELSSIGALATVDRVMLCAWCSAWSDFVECSEMLQREGLTIRLSNGVYCAHPAVAIKNQAARRLTSLSDRFGLTPAARTRLRTPGTDDTADDPLLQLIKSRDGESA